MNRRATLFKPLKTDIKKYDYVGFDVETYSNNGVQEFYFGSIYYYENNKEKWETYFDRETFISRLLTPRFKNHLIVATNLSFDFTQLFYGTRFWNDIKIIWRGGDMISCSYKLPNKKGTIKFIDTMNYDQSSVKKLGELIKCKKLESPSYMGKRKSKNNEELQYFIKYNIRDCKISCDYMYFFQKITNLIGGEVKLTIASSSLDTFRRSYMTRNFKKESETLQDDTILNFIRLAYYGGRTEVFKRGIYYNMNYYDINSLYPAMMLKNVPDPNSVFIPSSISDDNILNYMGCSYVLIECPQNLIYPVLPYRYNGKLIFPTGTFRGVYNHNELLVALENGYKILKIFRQVCYKNSLCIFKDYVKDLYSKRMEYKKQKSPFEKVVKYYMNSLYGKFCQSKREEYKITDINLLSINDQQKLLFESEGCDIKENFHIKREITDFDGIFTFPIWSSYITSYARITLYSFIKKYEPIYCDTDSIVTKHIIPESDKLGEMKFEDHLKSCEFIKPKMYRMETEKDNIIKIKGVNKATLDDFNNIVTNKKKVEKLKLSKLKESINRKMKPFTETTSKKYLDLEDNKRIWINERDSIPINMNEVLKE